MRPSSERKMSTATKMAGKITISKVIVWDEWPKMAAKLAYKVLSGGLVTVSSFCYINCILEHVVEFTLVRKLSEWSYRFKSSTKCKAILDLDYKQRRTTGGAFKYLGVFAFILELFLDAFFPSLICFYGSTLNFNRFCWFGCGVPSLSLCICATSHCGILLLRNSPIK